MLSLSDEIVYKQDKVVRQFMKEHGLLKAPPMRLHRRRSAFKFAHQCLALIAAMRSSIVFLPVMVDNILKKDVLTITDSTFCVNTVICCRISG